jgi:hypothetical protein
MNYRLEGGCLVGCCAVKSATFQRLLLPPSTGRSPWLQDATTQKTATFMRATVKTSDLNHTPACPWPTYHSKYLLLYWRQPFMGHILCFCPMGLTVSPASVLRAGEDRLSYRLPLRFNTAPQRAQATQILTDVRLACCVCRPLRTAFANLSHLNWMLTLK